MRPAFYIFCLMVAVGLLLYLLDLRGRKKKGDPGYQEPKPEPVKAGCADASCALHDMCPSEAVIACATKGITYYDDEELDVFKGRNASDYSEREIEQFRDVLYTLQPADLLGWEQSVKKRGIVLPAAIQDEFFMLYREADKGTNPMQ